MAQSICNISNIIPILKSSTNTKYGPESGLTRPVNSKYGVKAMKAERRDNLDHFQRPGLKRREVTTVPVGLWDRFPSARTVQQMMDTMDRMVDDPSAFGTRWSSPSPTDRSGYVRGRTPWDIKEVGVAYKVRFDMPGMTKDDVKIWVEESMLVIKAEKVPRKSDGIGNENGGVAEIEEDWPVKSYGTYSTRIALPENVEFEKIKAEVRDGVLYLTIPKPSLKSKVFDINVD
ncbi:hypothetical protein vseg_015285 [Gypsophila vaccaria]